MKKKTRKDRIDMKPIQFFTNKNIKREFQIVCIERGLKQQEVLQKLVVDFCRTNETRVLR